MPIPCKKHKIIRHRLLFVAKISGRCLRPSALEHFHEIIIKAGNRCLSHFTADLHAFRGKCLRCGASEELRHPIEDREAAKNLRRDLLCWDWLFPESVSTNIIPAIHRIAFSSGIHGFRGRNDFIIPRSNASVSLFVSWRAEGELGATWKYERIR